MTLAEALLVAVGAVAAIAAVGAWWAARSSSQASAAMTAIERRRWHADLTPQFELACRVTSGERATLRVALVGPAALDRIDRVTVRIRDDIPGRAPVTPGGPTAEEIARQVWGPYRFVPGVDGADQDRPLGRTVWAAVGRLAATDIDLGIRGRAIGLLARVLYPDLPP